MADLEACGATPIRFHDLRHTALTLMVESGINLKVVQSIGGHADIKTTRKYVHLLGDSIEKVAKNFSLSS
jgi:site-specific recombinase XerD